jgi:hypothetical protein
LVLSELDQIERALARLGTREIDDLERKRRIVASRVRSFLDQRRPTPSGPFQDLRVAQILGNHFAKQLPESGTHEGFLLQSQLQVEPESHESSGRGRIKSTSETAVQETLNCDFFCTRRTQVEVKRASDHQQRTQKRSFALDRSRHLSRSFFQSRLFSSA